MQHPHHHNTPVADMPAAALHHDDITLVDDEVTNPISTHGMPEEKSRIQPMDISKDVESDSKFSPEEHVLFNDPYSPPNRAIFASYFAVGFCIFFIVPPLTFYMVDDLSASAGQQSVVVGLMSLPWALKIFCGFLSDSVPINNQRRKPYLLIGWVLYLLFNVIPAALVEPNIAMVALFIFLQTWAFILSDVCTDAMIVDRSKIHKSDTTRGTLQATGYTIRFLGSIIGAVLGAILYNKGEWGWGCPMWAIFLINGIVPLLVVAPFYPTLFESSSEIPPNMIQQVAAMWDMVQRRAIWQPNAFIVLYNILYLTNPAWNSFLVEGLDFSNFDLGILTIGGAVLSYFGIVVYTKYLFNSSWRWVYVWTTVISAIFSCLQLILVLGWNKSIGMSGNGYDLLFAMGAYGVVQFVIAVQVYTILARMSLKFCSFYLHAVCTW